MFRFTQDDQSIKSGLRRMAAEQLDKMLEAYDKADEPTEAIHDLRKAAKRLRSLLRLVAPVFPAFRAENGFIRDAAAALSVTRDSQALIETFEHFVRADVPERFETTHAALVEDCQALSADGRDGVEAFVEMARSMRQRVDSWTLDASGFPALREGLGKTYLDARHGMRDARASGDPALFHEWRKAVKYHAQHLALLRDLAPDIIPAHRALADHLGETLGNHHNLAVFLETLARDPQRYGTSAEHKDIAGIVMAQAEALEHQAFAAGRQLLAEKPEALVQRLHFYWKHWRKD